MIEILFFLDAIASLELRYESNGLIDIKPFFHNDCKMQSYILDIWSRLFVYGNRIQTVSQITIINLVHC